MSTSNEEQPAEKGLFDDIGPEASKIDYKGMWVMLPGNVATDGWSLDTEQRRRVESLTQAKTLIGLEVIDRPSYLLELADWIYRGPARTVEVRDA